MIRNLAIAALVTSVLAMPSHPALAQNTLGGAIVGGVGGAIVGGAIGGYYYYRDRCYWPQPDGSYVPVDPRYCY
jgi:hypothetical protein